MPSAAVLCKKEKREKKKTAKDLIRTSRLVTELFDFPTKSDHEFKQEVWHEDPFWVCAQWACPHQNNNNINCLFKCPKFHNVFVTRDMTAPQNLSGRSLNHLTLTREETVFCQPPALVSFNHNHFPITLTNYFQLTNSTQESWWAAALSDELPIMF